MSAAIEKPKLYLSLCIETMLVAFKRWPSASTSWKRKERIQTIAFFQIETY
jgi:hypothetical protein